MILELACYWCFMSLTDNAEEELAAIRVALARGIESADTQEWPKIVRNIILRIERLTLRQAPTHFGMRSGLVTAERGPEYYRKIVATRETRHGGCRQKDSTPHYAPTLGTVAHAEVREMRKEEWNMSTPQEPKLPSPDPDPERDPPGVSPVPTSEPEEPGADVFDPGSEPLPA
jgi:hypothetical protein